MLWSDDNPSGHYGEPCDNTFGAAAAAVDQLDQDVSTAQSADGQTGIDLTEIAGQSNFPIILAMQPVHIIVDGVGIVVGVVLGSRGGLGWAFFGGIVGLGFAEIGYQLIRYGNLNNLFDR